MGQWISRHLNRCRQLIYDALSDKALGETEYVDGNVVNGTWILHHFDFYSFRLFGFLDDFGIPSAHVENTASRREEFAPIIYVAVDYRRRLFISQLES